MGPRSDRKQKREEEKNSKLQTKGHQTWMNDEIDDANKFVKSKSGQKDFLKLDFDDEDEDDDDDDDDDDEEEEEALMDVEETDSEDDDDSDDDSDDEELDSDDDEVGLLRAMKEQRKKLEQKRLRNKAEHSDDERDDDNSESESDDFDKDGKVKGKRKSDFYGDEDIDHEDVEEEEDRRDEEKAARLAQKARAKKMSAMDFGLDDDDEDDDEDDEDDEESSSEEEEEEEELTLQEKAERSKLGVKKKPTKKNKKTTSIDGKVVVEALDDDEKRTKRERLEDAAANLDEDAEVIALCDELKKTLAEVETNVEPLVKSAKRGEYITEEGITYLDTKYILLLSYCVNIVFYLMMKAEGQSVKDHPVVLKLVEIRSYIEKLRPIDKKLQYQVCFIVLLFSIVRTMCLRACVRIFSK
jgi:U3 small nucleolar RNA-associated protein 3